MPTLGEKIRILRKERGWSQTKLGQLANVSNSAISQWEADKIIPGHESLNALSSLFSTSLMVYGTDVEPSRAAIARAPVVEIKMLRGGLPSSLSGKKSVELSAAPRGFAFATTMPDRSMHPIIRIGDLIITDTGLVPDASDYVFLILKGRPTVRRLKITDSHLELIAENQDFAKHRFVVDDETVSMIGVVIETRWQREMYLL